MADFSCVSMPLFLVPCPHLPALIFSSTYLDPCSSYSLILQPGAVFFIATCLSLSCHVHADFSLCQPNTQGTWSCPSTCVVFEHSSLLTATLCHYTSMEMILTVHPSHSWLSTLLNVVRCGNCWVLLRVEHVSALEGKVVEESLYKSSEPEIQDMMLVVN